MSNEVTNRHDENVKLLERLAKVMKEALFENPPRLVDASRKTAEVQVDSEDFLMDVFKHPKYFLDPEPWYLVNDSF